jgi:hypothetical protein
LSRSANLDGASDFFRAASSSDVKRDLDDLLHATRTELDRHADKQIADAVLPLEENRVRHDLLLALQDDLDYFRRGRARRVLRAGPDELGDFGAAVRGAVADGLDLLGGVAACTCASAALFTSAEVTHLALLPQARTHTARRPDGRAARPQEG